MKHFLRSIRPVLAGVAALLCCTVLAAPIYSVQTLVLPAGAGGASAVDINNVGQIVGRTDNGSSFLWSNGSVQTFGTSNWRPTGVNDSGLVAGYNQPLFGTPNRGFKWNSLTGVSSNLNPPSGTNYADVKTAFNNGSVFGIVRSPSGNFQPYLWKANGQRITMPGWTSDMDVFRTAANEEGVVIAQFQKTSGEKGTLRWDTVSGTVTSLPLDGTERLSGYSSAGHLVGAFQTLSPFSVGPGFVWTAEKGFTEIDVPVGTPQPLYGQKSVFDPTAVNDEGWIVGTCVACKAIPGMVGTRGVLFDGASSYFLDDLLLNGGDLPSGMLIGTAIDINDEGWILATGYINDGSSMWPAFTPLLLIPTLGVPAPSGLALLLGGLAVLVHRRKMARR